MTETGRYPSSSKSDIDLSMVCQRSGGAFRGCATAPKGQPRPKDNVTIEITAVRIIAGPGRYKRRPLPRSRC
jgi:hypothetical protein